MLLIQRFHTYTVATDTGFGTTGGFGTSAFGTTTNTGGLFGSTQNKPGLSFMVCLYSLYVHKPNVWIDEICANNNHMCDIHEGLVLVPVSQGDFLGPVHSASRPLPLPALALVLGPPAAHQPACLATLGPAPQADSSHSKTMHSVQTNLLPLGVSSIIMCLYFR